MSFDHLPRKKKQSVKRTLQNFWIIKKESIDLYIHVTTERNAKLAQGIGQAIPVQAWTGPECSGTLKLQDFKIIDTSKR